MIQVLSKIKLWEEIEEPAGPHANLSIHELVDKDWYLTACKHYCEPCNRWFSDVRGKLMHDRHRHKAEL